MFEETYWFDILVNGNREAGSNNKDEAYKYFFMYGEDGDCVKLVQKTRKLEIGRGFVYRRKIIAKKVIGK